MEKMTNDVKDRALNVCMAEVAEALKDMAFSANMPHHEHRVNKLAGCVAGLERANVRMRKMVLAQGDEKAKHYVLVHKEHGALEFIGPFDTMQAARDWGDEHVTPQQYTWTDVLTANPLAAPEVREPAKPAAPVEPKAAE